MTENTIRDTFTASLELRQSLGLELHRWIQHEFKAGDPVVEMGLCPPHKSWSKVVWDEDGGGGIDVISPSEATLEHIDAAIAVLTRWLRHHQYYIERYITLKDGKEIGVWSAWPHVISYSKLQKIDLDCEDNELAAVVVACELVAQSHKD